MILPKPEDAIHKAQMFRILAEMLDNSVVSQNIFFKGGTCAAMLGFLDRFSIDLDFDVKQKSNKAEMDNSLRHIFNRLDFSIDQKSKGSLFYVLKYKAGKTFRNTVKLSLIDQPIQSNSYASFYLPEIDRLAVCQTKETMFGNKLVAVTDRYKKYRAIAGRDIYDIHHFFFKGYRYKPEIIEDRTGDRVIIYLENLISFIDKKITEKIISEDLSYLLSYDKFKLIRKVLKRETLLFLKDEVKRLKG